MLTQADKSQEAKRLSQELLEWSQGAEAQGLNNALFAVKASLASH